MENKKSNKGLVALIIILIIIIIGLGSYIVYDKFINTNKDKKDTVEVKETKKEESILKDKSKPIVYTLGNYKYKKVPFINIDSDDAERLNNEIDDYVTKSGKDTDYGEGYSLSYDYFQNDEILSVLLKIDTIGASKYYKTVNINTKTGKKVSNSDLLKIKNIDENGIGNAIFDIYVKDAEESGYIDTYKTQHIYGDGFTSVYDGTKMLIDSKKIDDFDMYLNSKGDLCVIEEVYLIAGPEKNFYKFNLNINSYEK